MGGGSSQPANTTQTTDLPEWARPYAQDLLTRGSALSQQQIPVYTGQRSANLNPYQTQAMDMVQNRALNGSQEIGAGSRNLMATLNGDYLNSNPYLQGAIDTASRGLVRNYQAATNGTDATFARNNAFGGSAWNQAKANDSYNLAQGLGDVANNMAYSNYAGERANQMNALNTALTYGQQPYMDAQQLANAGQTQYAYDQQKIDDAMAQFTDQTQSPYKQLDVLGNTLRGAVGGGGTVTSSVPGPNPYAQLLGGGAFLGGLLG